MAFIVTFRFRGKSEYRKCRASSMKIDGKGSLVLYDEGRTIIEKLTLADLSDFSIESIRSRAARSAS